VSIVIIIIGLIIGAIATGSTLIKAAELRKVISQIESYNTAVNTFKLKYNGLPGDMVNATDYWPLDSNCAAGQNSFSTEATCNGNGDGMIGGYTFSDPSWPATFGEVFAVFNQLALARLVQGTYGAAAVCAVTSGALPFGTPTPVGCNHNITPNIPASYNGGGVELMYTNLGVGGTIAGATNSKHVFTVGSAPVGWGTNTGPIGSASNNAGGRTFSSSDAYFIDAKADDGLPYSGKILATWDQWGDYCGKSASGINSYTMQNNVAQGFPILPAGCALFFIASF